MRPLLRRLGDGAALGAGGGEFGGSAGNGPTSMSPQDDAGGAANARYRGATLAAVTQQSRAKAQEATAALASAEAKGAHRQTRCEACLAASGCGRWLAPAHSRRASSVPGAVPSSRTLATTASAAPGTGEAPARTFANESRAFTSLFVRMAWPIAAFIAYYVGMYVLRGNTAVASAYAHSAVLWSVELEVLSTSVGYNFRNMFWYTEPAWNAAFTDRLSRDLDEMASIAEDVVYGSEQRKLQSLIATSPSTYYIMLVNGCVQSSVSAKACAVFGPSPYYGCNTYYPYELCYSDPASTNSSEVKFHFGIVGRGLYPALLEFFLRAKEAVAANEAQLLLGPGALVYQSMDHDSVGGLGALTVGQFVNEMASAYLAGGFNALSSGIEAEAVATVSAQVNVDTLAVVFSSLALAAMYLLVYRPLIVFLDLEIKRSHHLLLLVPEEIAKVVPAVVQAGQRLAVMAQD